MTATGDTTPPVSTGVNVADGVVEVRLSSIPGGKEISMARLTISSVEVHVPDGWLKMKMGLDSVDLKQVEGSEQLVATISLSQGTYTQIRVGIARPGCLFRKRPAQES